MALFATTVNNMHQILWPALFEYLTNNEYSRASNVLCKNLAHIAEQKRESDSEDYLINYDSFINIPKPYEILARLIVLCGCPLNGNNRGLNILNLMKNMGPNIDTSIVDLWDSVIPKLIINLEGKIKCIIKELKKKISFFLRQIDKFKIFSKKLGRFNNEITIQFFGSNKQRGKILRNR